VDKHPDWGSSYAQRPLLYHNLKNGKFELVPAVEGTGLAVVSVGRGAAFGDIFNDGKIDVVINNMDGVPVLLRNVNPDHHNWVELKLIGGPKSPRDAVGATVYLAANGMRQRGDVLSGGSYLSSNDLRVHFGLNDATDAGTAEIHWPSGAKEMVKLPAVDRIYTITEGQGITGALCGGKPVRGCGYGSGAGEGEQALILRPTKESGGCPMSRQPPESHTLQDQYRRQPQSTGRPRPCLEPNE
jgi:hypothetical protein